MVMNDPGAVFNPENIVRYGGITILCITIFAETGIFFCFFFPGDSLVFTAGVLCATGVLPYGLLTVILAMCISATLGNMVGYWFGKRTGPFLTQRHDSWFFRKEYVTMAHDFYERYGGLALILGRFLPVVRTFVPIVAGVLKISYRNFIFYSTLGAVLWIIPITVAGYFLGTLPFVQENLGYIIIGMVIVITAPVIFRLFKKENKK